MENLIIFPIIIIILGFTYLGVTIFLYKRKEVPIGIPTMPIFWMIKKENNPKYFLFSIIFNIILFFIIIIFGLSLLFKVL